MPHRNVRTTSLIILLCAFSTVLTCGVWLSTWHQIDASETRALAGAEHDAASFARVIEEHTGRTIHSADQAVRFIQYEYQEKGKAVDLPGLIDHGIVLNDIFNLYTVVDENADVILSSKAFKPLNLADREHIRVHRERADVGLFVSKPVLGRVSRKWSIQLTRRIDRRGGGFGGVVVVSMDPFYFTRLYESASIGTHSVVTLIGTDGVVRARRSGGVSSVGQDLKGSALLRRFGDRSEGVVREASPIDRRDRVYAFRRLDSYPLLVCVGIDVDDALAETAPLRTQLLLQAIASTLAILVFTGVLAALIRRLIRSREAALQANAAKTQFLSNMSHELRTPLNGILGYAELLELELADPTQREYAAIIQDSGNHLLALVNQLLQLNRIEAGRERLFLHPEDIRAIGTQALNAHRSSALKKGLALAIEIGDGVPASVVCDRLKLVQVLHNLLHNAIKFTDAGAVKLAIARSGDELEFVVSDTGRGIPADMVTRVFERFFQVDSRDARIGDGAGMGLALVRELVGLMHGSIAVESGRDGTSFQLRLPLAQPDTASVPEKTSLLESA